jgi:hypothetical protein
MDAVFICPAAPWLVNNPTPSSKVETRVMVHLLEGHFAIQQRESCACSEQCSSETTCHRRLARFGASLRDDGGSRQRGIH